MFPACHLVKRPIVFASAPLCTYYGFNQVSEKKKGGACCLFGGGVEPGKNHLHDGLQVKLPSSFWKKVTDIYYPRPDLAPQISLKVKCSSLPSGCFTGGCTMWAPCGKCLFPHVPGRKSGSQKMSVLGKPFTMYRSKSQAPNRTTLQQMAPFLTLYICVCVCVRTHPPEVNIHGN